jgi:hypothetical protein
MIFHSASEMLGCSDMVNRFPKLAKRLQVLSVVAKQISQPQADDSRKWVESGKGNSGNESR